MIEKKPRKHRLNEFRAQLKILPAGTYAEIKHKHIHIRGYIGKDAESWLNKEIVEAGFVLEHAMWADTFTRESRIYLYIIHNYRVKPSKKLNYALSDIKVERVQYATI